MKISYSYRCEYSSRGPNDVWYRFNDDCVGNMEHELKRTFVLQNAYILFLHMKELKYYLLANLVGFLVFFSLASDKHNLI